MLEVKNISMSFGKTKVLDNISFKVNKNTVVGLLGPNGAGKTTLMRIIVGFYKANQGKLLWNGKIVDTKSVVHHSRVGYLPESNPLYGYLTVAEYLSFVEKLKEKPGEIQGEKLIKIVGECGLKEVVGQKIETLSKGYKQRVGLAAALIGDPEILILDEPTSGLDPNQIIEIRTLVKKLAKKKMVILSTHILPEAKAVCNQIMVINRGKIVMDQETKTIKNLEKKFVKLTV